MDQPEPPVPLHCRRWLPGRSAPFCFPSSPAAPHEPVQVTEQAETQPTQNKCSFQVGWLNRFPVGLDRPF